jgi:hypothetical protein
VERSGRVDDPTGITAALAGASAAAGAVGFGVLYLPARTAVGAFYGQLGVQPEELGLGYVETISPVVVISLIPVCIVIVTLALLFFAAAERPAVITWVARADQFFGGADARGGIRTWTRAVLASFTLAGLLFLLAFLATSHQLATFAALVFVAGTVLLAHGAARFIFRRLLARVADYGRLLRAPSSRQIALIGRPVDTELERSRRLVLAVSVAAFACLPVLVGGLAGWALGGSAKDGNRVEVRLLGQRLPLRATPVNATGGIVSGKCLMMLGAVDGVAVVFAPGPKSVLYVDLETTQLMPAESCTCRSDASARSSP